MLNLEPGRRDAARLVALAEAVAELADEHGQRDLAGFALGTARRFDYTVTPTDRDAVAVYRREVAGMLRAAHHDMPATRGADSP